MKLGAVLAMLVACGSGAQEPVQPAPGASLADASNAEGIAAMEANDYARARAKFRDAYLRTPTAKLAFNLCTAAYLEGAILDARLACQSVEQHAPDHDLAQKTQALLARMDTEGQPRAPAPVPEEVEPAPAATGGQAKIAAEQNQAGVELMNKQRYAEASARFREAVARVPEARYFFNLCVAHFQEGKFGDALAACAAGNNNNPTAELRAKIDKMIVTIQTEARAQKLHLE